MERSDVFLLYFSSWESPLKGWWCFRLGWCSGAISKNRCVIYLGSRTGFADWLNRKHEKKGGRHKVCLPEMWVESLGRRWCNLLMPQEEHVLGWGSKSTFGHAKFKMHFRHPSDISVHFCMFCVLSPVEKSRLEIYSWVVNIACSTHTELYYLEIEEDCWVRKGENQVLSPEELHFMAESRNRDWKKELRSGRSHSSV